MFFFIIELEWVYRYLGLKAAWEHVIKLRLIDELIDQFLMFSRLYNELVARVGSLANHRSSYALRIFLKFIYFVTFDGDQQVSDGKLGTIYLFSQIKELVRILVIIQIIALISTLFYVHQAV